MISRKERINKPVKISTYQATSKESNPTYYFRVPNVKGKFQPDRFFHKKSVTDTPGVLFFFYCHNFRSPFFISHTSSNVIILTVTFDIEWLLSIGSYYLYHKYIASIQKYTNNRLFLYLMGLWRVLLSIYIQREYELRQNKCLNIDTGICNYLRLNIRK